MHEHLGYSKSYSNSDSESSTIQEGTSPSVRRFIRTKRFGNKAYNNALSSIDDAIHGAHYDANETNESLHMQTVQTTSSTSTISSDTSPDNVSQGAGSVSRDTDIINNESQTCRTQKLPLPLASTLLNQEEPIPLQQEPKVYGSVQYPRIAAKSRMPPSSVKLLKNIYQDLNISNGSRNISDSDIRELMAVADFMFSAQSYHDSFKICQTLWSVVGPSRANSLSTSSAKSMSLWIPLALSMVRSAQTPDEYLSISSMMKDLPTRSEWPEHYKSNEYCMLLGLVSNICLELEDSPQAETTFNESWKHYQTLISKRPLVQFVLQTTLHHAQLPKTSKTLAEHVGHKVFGQLRRRVTVDSCTFPTMRGLHIPQPTVNSVVDRHLQEILTWCLKSMSQQEFFFLVSNIDATFWNVEVDDHDVREFERRVVFCYLSERLQHCEGSQQTILHDLYVQSGILRSFQEVYIHSGMNKMETLAAVVKAVSRRDTTQKTERSQATLPERWLELAESIRKEMVLQSCGYAQVGRPLTSNTLLEHFEWSGKLGIHHEQYHDRTYQRCVENFLRDFSVTSLELDLSERIEQASRYSSQAQSCQEETFTFRPCMSKRWVDGYQSFEATARDICGDAAFTSSEHVPGLSYGAEDWKPQRSGYQNLFRYYDSAQVAETKKTTSKNDKQRLKIRSRGEASGGTQASRVVDRGTSRTEFI